MRSLLALAFAFRLRPAANEGILGQIIMTFKGFVGFATPGYGALMAPRTTIT